MTTLANFFPEGEPVEPSCKDKCPRVPHSPWCQRNHPIHDRIPEEVYVTAFRAMGGELPHLVRALKRFTLQPHVCVSKRRTNFTANFICCFLTTKKRLGIDSFTHCAYQHLNVLQPPIIEADVTNDRPFQAVLHQIWEVYQAGETVQQQLLRASHDTRALIAKFCLKDVGRHYVVHSKNLRSVRFDRIFYIDPATPEEPQPIVPALVLEDGSPDHDGNPAATLTDAERVELVLALWLDRKYIAKRERAVRNAKPTVTKQMLARLRGLHAEAVEAGAAALEENGVEGEEGEEADSDSDSANPSLIDAESSDDLALVDAAQRAGRRPGQTATSAGTRRVTPASTPARPAPATSTRTSTPRAPAAQATRSSPGSRRVGLGR